MGITSVCCLIFFATTVNYLDRAVISLLKPYLTKDFHWNDGDYANVEIAFKVAYSVGLLFAGRLIDRLGTKMGYFFSTLLWSVSAVFHALANSTFGFIIVRSALGLSEAGNFPSAIKTVAEWFPKKERALATGIFNSGSNIGAMICALIIPVILAAWNPNEGNSLSSGTAAMTSLSSSWGLSTTSSGSALGITVDFTEDGGGTPCPSTNGTLFLGRHEPMPQI